MRIRGHGTLVVGRDSGARDFPDRRTHDLATLAAHPNFKSNNPKSNGGISYESFRKRSNRTHWFRRRP